MSWIALTALLTLFITQYLLAKRLDQLTDNVITLGNYVNRLEKK